jgi:osmotically-inducible protein OsmY
MDGLADADTIHVETDGTEIVLTGTVRSFAEVNQACHAAWSVPA